MSVVWKNFDIHGFEVSVSRGVQGSVPKAVGCKLRACLQVFLKVLSP